MIVKKLVLQLLMTTTTTFRRRFEVRPLHIVVLVLHAHGVDEYHVAGKLRIFSWIDSFFLPPSLVPSFFENSILEQ